ncbi:MAG: DUF4159 domain-containing protein [bacterium]
MTGIANNKLIAGKYFFLLFLALVYSGFFAGSLPAAELQLARLQYDGGGDWYNDPSKIPNLMEFYGEETGNEVLKEQAVVRADDEEIFEYPLVFVTGHGNIDFSAGEIKNLRRYLKSGGFLYADDDYGMDEAFRREISRVFPDRPLIELSAEHPVFSAKFEFKQLPRIHEHYPDDPPRALGIKVDGEWVLLYTYNTNIADGWASPDVHDDPPEVRKTALKFGVNIINWVFSQ